MLLKVKKLTFSQKLLWTEGSNPPTHLRYVQTFKEKFPQTSPPMVWTMSKVSKFFKGLPTLSLLFEKK